MSSKFISNFKKTPAPRKKRLLPPKSCYFFMKRDEILYYLCYNYSWAISYVLNNIFTFRDSRNNAEWSLVALLKVYFSYFFTGIVINSILLWFWNDRIGINKDLSPILNLFFTIPMNFVLSKLWAYRK